ncbi:hypothetical protein BKA80DRAFT_252005 [Phyllosticta citrichinensis]
MAASKTSIDLAADNGSDDEKVPENEGSDERETEDETGMRANRDDDDDMFCGVRDPGEAKVKTKAGTSSGDRRMDRSRNGDTKAARHLELSGMETQQLKAILAGLVAEKTKNLGQEALVNEILKVEGE